jgi:hypothetical protein
MPVQLCQKKNTSDAGRHGEIPLDDATNPHLTNPTNPREKDVLFCEG